MGLKRRNAWRILESSALEKPSESARCLVRTSSTLGPPSSTRPVPRAKPAGPCRVLALDGASSTSTLGVIVRVLGVTTGCGGGVTGVAGVAGEVGQALFGVFSLAEPAVGTLEPSDRGPRATFSAPSDCECPYFFCWLDCFIRSSSGREVCEAARHGLSSEECCEAVGDTGAGEPIAGDSSGASRLNEGLRESAMLSGLCKLLRRLRM
mmetsp:Transcript_117622/g.344412  ORF Transcript_117622/g.344412 Transcript_117622/m.344412 type:complete len:208 (-) Transcript_117622:267-890(-)